MAEVEIVQQRTVASPDPGRAGQPDTWITYRVLPNGALDSVLVHGAAPSPQEIQTAVKAHVAARGQSASQRFTV